MSVYTVIDTPQLESFLTHYSVGDLIEFKGIADGIVNTNYFVTTTKGRFVLTLFETLRAEELPYFLDLMAYLAEHGVPSAHPVADENQAYLRSFMDKPAALVQRLRGSGVKTANVAQCQALGDALGLMHVVTPAYPRHRENFAGPHWWRITAGQLRSRLSREESELLEAELAFQTGCRHLQLPRGAIHADLFRDNALFEGDELCGIIDFYYACNDVLLYDVAVAVNDWCSTDDSELDPERLQVLLQAYTKRRPLTKEERRFWPVLLRAAALRFWLSRLQDKHFPRPGELTHIKDPAYFQHILQARIRQSPDDLLPV